MTDLLYIIKAFVGTFLFFMIVWKIMNYIGPFRNFTRKEENDRRNKRK